MKNKIQDTLLNSNDPTQDICELMGVAEKKQANKHGFYFIGTIFILNIVFAYQLRSNKPTNEDIYNICRPIVDSVQAKYQAKLDFMVDSLEMDYYSKLKKR